MKLNQWIQQALFFLLFFYLFVCFFHCFGLQIRHLRHKAMRNCKQAHVGSPRGVIPGCRTGDSSPRKSTTYDGGRALCTFISVKTLTGEHFHLGRKLWDVAEIGNRDVNSFLQIGHSSVIFYHVNGSCWPSRSCSNPLEAAASARTLPPSSQTSELQLHFVNKRVGWQHWQQKFRNILTILAKTNIYRWTYAAQ